MSATMAIIVVFFSTLAVIFFVWLSVVLWTLRNGISPMPTAAKVRHKVLSLVPPETQGTIVDLGSGWGNMTMQFAKLFPHCQVVGYETSLIPYYVSKMWAFFDRTPNIKFVRRNFFKVPLSQISLIYCYLYPGAMKKLVSKFNEELNPGTIIISNTFSLPGWEAVKILEVKDLYNTRVYVYIKSTSNVEALHAKEALANEALTKSV